MTMSEINNIVKNGVFIADMGVNWELWQFGDILYSIAKPGSGANSSCWCAIKKLRAHLWHLRQVCGYDKLIPPYWTKVNHNLLHALKII